jgi:ribonuclease HI
MAWERRRYRGNKVWIEHDESGRPLLDQRGLAALRYKPEDERTYSVRPEEILPLETAADEPAAAGAPQVEDARPGVARENGIDIYTDGASSGNPGPAGLGVVLRWRDRGRELRRYLGEATNNEAELAAVLAALEAVTRPDLTVRLHTDSEYVIGVLVGGHRVKANVDLIRRIRAAMTRFTALEFVKVPAHAGVPGNERADALARTAIRERGPG